MSGVGPLGNAGQPTPLRSIDKDGGGRGSGGRYEPQHQPDPEQESDEAEISAEARDAQESHTPRQADAPARPEATDARLEILSDIHSFNERHQRQQVKMNAILRPTGDDGQVLVIEDPTQGVVVKPFDDRDIFYFSPQEVRTKLEAFDRSSGSLFDSTG